MRSNRAAALVATITVLAAGGATYLAASSGSSSKTPSTAPTAFASPRPPLLAPLPSGAPEPTQAGLAAALAPGLADPALGGSVAGAVIDPSTGRVLWSQAGDRPVPPASTAKLAVAVAALTVLPPTARLRTRTVLSGDMVVLVGGGDPTLAGPAQPASTPHAASLPGLATATATALRARRVGQVTLAVDNSADQGPPTAPGWDPVYVTEGDVAPVSALEVDEGRPFPGAHTRVADPGAAAGAVFARLLAARGVAVRGPVRTVIAPPSATPLAQVLSPTVPDLVEHMLTVSDNDVAEALGRELARAERLPATFAGAAQAIRAGVSRAGVDPSGLQMVDASGLSVRDRATPLVLLRLLALAAGPRGGQDRPVLDGLPVAGFTGTLADRFRSPPVSAAAGVLRAKTGTLSGVSTLAGLVVDASGRLLAFSLVADHAPAPTAAEAALDRAAAVLRTCGCR